MYVYANDEQTGAFFGCFEQPCEGLDIQSASRHHRIKEQMKDGSEKTRQPWVPALSCTRRLGSPSSAHEKSYSLCWQALASRTAADQPAVRIAAWRPDSNDQAAYQQSKEVV